MVKKRKSTTIKKNHSSGNKPDRSLLILIGIFLVVGLLAIYDATVVLAQELYGDAYRFVFLQLSWILVGLIGFYIFFKLDFKLLKKISTPLFYITVALLGVLAIFGVLPCEVNFIFAPCVNGANRWFYINPSPLPQLPLLGVLGFQVSELAKFSMILYLSYVLEKSIRIGKKHISAFLVATGIISFLIVLQPNMSTALLIYAIGSAIYYSSTAPVKPKIILDFVFVVLGALAALVFKHTRERVLTFFSLGEGGDLSTGYHIKQILIALGSGGTLGVGFGQSRQKFQYLPEVFADSIFAVIGEELGFLGTSMIVFLFVLLVFKGFSIAKKASSIYSKMLAVGVTTWVALQFFVNVGAMTKLIPLTGIPLPLISYGGSSLVFMMMGLGVLANVSREGR
jgi:cell division protein FtsW